MIVSYLSIIEKLKILLDMILDFKFIFISLGIIIITTFLYLIKKINTRKYILTIILSLLLIFGIDIIVNYKELSKVFDNFMTIFFSNIYFPSIYVYISTLVIVFIAFMTSMFNKMLNKAYKIINGIVFIINNILLVIVLNIIAKNKIDVFTPNDLYTNINLVAILEISMSIFIFWILSLIVIYATSVICDRIGNRRREKVTCGINTEPETYEEDIPEELVPEEELTPVMAIEETIEPSISVSELEDKTTDTELEELTPVMTIEETIEPSISVSESEDNINSSPVETISEIENKINDTELEEVSLIENTKEESDTISIEEIKEEPEKETIPTFTFDDILNGRIPVDYYDNTLEVDAPNIVNPQEIFENKYKEYKANNIESFQDIANDIEEDKVVIIKNNKAKDNLKINTVSLDSLEEKEDIVDTVMIEETSSNESINEVVEESDKTDIIIPSKEAKKTSYTLEDYKKFATMLTKLKDFTNNNNVSIDDAVTISLINNYSIDDCLKFKEILESNLN